MYSHWLIILSSVPTIRLTLVAFKRVLRVNVRHMTLCINGLSQLNLLIVLFYSAHWSALSSSANACLQALRTILICFLALVHPSHMLTCNFKPMRSPKESLRSSSCDISRLASLQLNMVTSLILGSLVRKTSLYPDKAEVWRVLDAKLPNN